MAKALKPSEAARPTGIAAGDLKRIVTSINKAKEKAAEHVGQAGQQTKQAIEDYNLDRKALTFVAGLARKEPAQQQATLRGLIEYADKLGMFEQISMFDDLIPVLEGIVSRARAGEEAPRPATERSGVVASLLTPAH
jgi:hypothetical protein